MTIDVMELVRQDLAKAEQYQQQSGSLWPLFLKPGQRALFRLTLNMNQLARVEKHSLWESRRPVIQAICDNPATCFYCEQAKENRRLETQALYALPCYVYGIKDAANQLLMRKDNPVLPVQGMRYLEMSIASATFTMLLDCFEKRGTVVDRDFTLKCSDVKGRTMYTLIGEDASKFTPPEELPVYTTEDLIVVLAERYPPKMIGASTPPPAVSAGASLAAKAIVPDF